MSPAIQFLDLAAEWAAHCQAVSSSSSPAAYLAHPAVDRIAALGPAAVPLIMARYETDPSCPWEYPLATLTGVSMIADPDCVDGAEVARRRLAWWAANRHRYRPPAGG